MSECLRALAHVKRVLVLHDMHPDADNAVWRAGLLARAQGGWLRILHVSRLRSPAAALERLEPLAWRLQEHLQLAVVPQAFRGSAASELRRAAEDADVIVLRALSGFDAVTGLQPLRAVQTANRPTLVVRTPASVAYRRLLVGVGAQPDAQLLLASGRALTDGKEVPAFTPLRSAVSLLERERALFPDVVALACTASPSLARRFLSLTAIDTLLLPDPPSAPTMRRKDGARTPMGSGMLVSSTELPLAGERS